MAKKEINQTELNTTTEYNKNITDFFSGEYKEWAKSVVEERALPSVIDGFKPTARKVVHAANVGSLKDGKLYKLLALSGDSMKLSLYSHGDASLNQVIINLCKSFNDNFNPLESDSQVGTLRDPDSAGSPRYLYVKQSPWMSNIYKTDYNLLNFVFEEGQYVEPEYYLPIIPTVLCKNNIGVAVGYAMHNISYNPLNIIDACIEYLNTSDINKTIVKPFIRHIKNSNWKLNSDGKWMNYGEWSYNIKRDKMSVTDLPYDMTYDGFEKLLNKMQEKCIIKSWTNLSTGETLDYEITFNKGDLKKMFLKDKDGVQLATKMKLIKQVPDDLLWLLDENKKLSYFNTIYSVIKYFVKFRLGIYEQRKERTTKYLEEKYKENSDLVKFIELVASEQLNLRNRPKADIKKDMEKYNLPIVLINTPMSKLTKEEQESLLKENQSIKEELEYIKNTTEKEMYINDLKDLKSKIKNEFK